MIRRFFPFVLPAAGFLLVSCGYHVGGQADLVPKSIQTISVPRFQTTSTRYKIVDELPEAIGREFIARTRFRIVNDPSQADAVLNGAVNRVAEFPYLSDPTTGKATSIRIFVTLTVNLIEKKTGRVLYSNSNWAFHQDYDFAVDPHQYFDESGPAFDRLCRDVSHELVSAVVENF